ncbi:MAG: ABC transporter ATP-binding protein [Kofleriaceae bacterium]|nr:ABC transporter ATP-binding protein [Kofleriaceae bacterium]
MRRALAVPWRAAPVASALGIVLAIAFAVIPATTAYLTRALIDTLGRGEDVTELAIAAAAVTSLGAGVYFASRYVEGIVHARIRLHVERELFARVVAEQQLGFFEDPAFHQRLVLATDAARTAPQELATGVEMLVRSVIGIIALAGIVFVVWPPIAVLLAGLGVLGFVAQLARIRHEVRLSELMAHDQRWYVAYHQLLVDPRAAKELRLFGTTELMRDRMLARLGENTRNELARQRIGIGAQIALAVAGAAISVLGTVMVAARIRAGELAVADVVLFMAAITGIQAAVGSLVQNFGHLGSSLELFRYYLALVDVPPARTTGRDVPPLRDAIVLRDVWFRYADNTPWVLRGVDLEIRAGRATGLVGVNGAGKSTLLKLLGRFYDPTRGQILWDGIDLRELDPAALRRQLAATFQDFMTYQLSAAENIGIADGTALEDRARITGAAAIVGIDQTLSRLPSGYDTLLSAVVTSDGDEGQVASLSGGQWQRIAIARTLLRATASVVILDEPSAGLDAQAEHELQMLVGSHFANATRILVSHRLSAMRGADQIAVLADGVIAERGTHDDLMAARGAYAKWFALQAAAYQDARVGAAA